MTPSSLAETAALVNTVELDGDTLVTLADLDDFLARHPSSGVIHRTHEELESVRALRPRLRKFWTVKIATRRQLWSTRSSRRQMRGPTCPDTMSGTGTTRHRPERPARRPHRGRRGDGLSRSDQGRRARPAADMCRGGLRGCAGRSFQEFLEALLRHRNCGNRTNVAAYRARKRQQSA